MSKLNVVGSIIDKVADRIDDFTFDKQEKAELIQEINKAQIEVNKVESGHTSIFVAGWRPFVCWTCGIALCYHFVIQPFLVFLLYSFGYQVDLPAFDMTTLTTILMGLLGLGGLRSYEKVKKSV